MYGASVCNVVLDVHVKQYDMYMWSSTTCASHTALHVHVKQDSAPGKGAFLSEIDKAQYRARVVILPGVLPVLKDTSGKLHYFQV